jgi:hypothetical protein
MTVAMEMKQGQNIVGRAANYCSYIIRALDIKQIFATDCRQYTMNGQH